MKAVFRENRDGLLSLLDGKRTDYAQNGAIDGRHRRPTEHRSGTADARECLADAHEEQGAGQRSPNEPKEPSPLQHRELLGTGALPMGPVIFTSA